MDPDLVLHRERPRRVDVGGLAPGDTIAQGASASVLIKAESIEELHVRAQVTGTTADLDVARKLADKETDAADQPATEALADGVESLLTVTAVGESYYELTVTNTGAGPDVTIAYIDLFPYFRHAGSLR